MVRREEDTLGDISKKAARHIREHPKHKGITPALGLTEATFLNALKCSKDVEAADLVSEVRTSHVLYGLERRRGFTCAAVDCEVAFCKDNHFNAKYQDHWNTNHRGKARVKASKCFVQKVCTNLVLKVDAGAKAQQASELVPFSRLLEKPRVQAETPATSDGAFTDLTNLLSNTGGPSDSMNA